MLTRLRQKLYIRTFNTYYDLIEFTYENGQVKHMPVPIFIRKFGIKTLTKIKLDKRFRDREFFYIRANDNYYTTKKMYVRIWKYIIKSKIKRKIRKAKNIIKNIGKRNDDIEIIGC